MKLRAAAAAAAAAALLVLALPAAASSPVPVRSGAVPEVPGVLVVLADGASTADLLRADLPFLTRLRRGGGAAILTFHPVPEAGQLVVASRVLTLATGAAVRARPEALVAGSPSQVPEAAGAFLARTGGEAPTSSVLVVDPRPGPGSDLPDGLRPGVVADALREAGRDVSVYGNADGAGGRERLGALLAMDSDGVVPSGEVGDAATVASGAVLGGARMSGAIASRVREDLRSGGLVVLDWGDLRRIDAEAGLASQHAWDDARLAALHGVDSFLEGLEMPRGAAVMVVSAVAPAKGKERKDSFGVLVMGTVGFETTGGERLLTSASTRRQGIVADADFAPSLLALFDLPVPSTMAGNPIRRSSGAVGPESLLSLACQARGAAGARGLAQGLLAALTIVFGLAGLALAGIARRWASLSRSAKPSGSKGLELWCAALGPVRAGLLGCLALPGAYLVSAGLYREGGPIAVLVGIAIAAAVGMCALALKRHIPPAAVAAMFSATVVLCDLGLGAPLALRAYLGGNPFDGERFFGIGNGYAAILLAVVAVVLAFTRPTRRQSTGMLAVLALVYGLPWLGADVGGAATVAGAACAVWVFWGGRRMRRRDGLYALLASALAVGGSLMVDAFRPGATHAGGFVRRAAEAGWGEVARVAAHKMAMNAETLLHLPLSVFGPIALVIIGVLAWRRARAGDGDDARGAAIMAAACAAGVPLILLNDTGLAASNALAQVLVVAAIESKVTRSGGQPADGMAPLGLS
ncbi:MAG: hypothetical protein WDA71_02410 [Actinomycetota bacterium]